MTTMKFPIEKLASEFRTAIEMAKKEGEFEADFIFSRFPRGCCGDVSSLLGQYLLENNIKSNYVCGNRYFKNQEEGMQSHAWLVVDRMIVDITGDQFSNKKSYYNYDKRVYVGTGDLFHELFEVEDRNVREFYGIESYSAVCRQRLFTLYEKIKKYCLL